MRETLAARGRRGQRDDRLAAARERGAAHEVHLPADAGEDAWPIESAHTWPVRSISIAELIATTLSFLRMSEVSFVRSHGWNSTSRLSSTKSKSARRAVDEARDGAAGVHLLVPVGDDAASSERDRAPSENISVWTPRSCLLPRRASTASGMPPMPICSVEPSSTRSAMSSPMRASTSRLRLARLCSGSGRSVCTKASTRSKRDDDVAVRARHLLVDLGDDDASPSPPRRARRRPTCRACRCRGDRAATAGRARRRAGSAAT